MPRKAGKPGAKRGGAHVTGEATTSDTFVDSCDPNSSDQADVGSQITPTQRGEPATRASKRRRISNNVNNSASSHGIYGSGTIVASNPFDDDFPTSDHSGSAGVVEKEHGIISKQSSSPLSLSPQYQAVLPPLHLPTGCDQQQVHPLHPSHQMHQNQQAFPPDQYFSYPEEHLQQRDIRDPMTPTPYPPYNMDHMSRHPAPSDLINLPPAPLLPDSYSHNLDDVLPDQSPYSSNNLLAYCRRCQREIYLSEPSIVCKASCRTYFHSACSGLTQLAYEMLMQEASRAEWACDDCTSTDWQVPLVKYKH